MEDDPPGAANGRAAPRPDVGRRLPGSNWVGVAVLGIALFGLGIWEPAWRGVPGGSDGLNYVAAAAGAVLAVVGFTYAARRRAADRGTAVADLPGVEFFSPPTHAAVEPAEPDEEGR
jgi:hypothetical protein